jgi:hypothetical protein
MTLDETYPGRKSAERAAERVALACRALSGAANDLRVAHAQNKVMAVDDAAQQLESEVERVCELAEELSSLAMNLRSLQLLATSAGPAD